MSGAGGNPRRRTEGAVRPIKTKRPQAVHHHLDYKERRWVR